MGKLSEQNSARMKLYDEMAEVYADYLVKLEELESNTALDDAARNEVFSNILQEEFMEKLQELRKHGL